MPLGSWKKKKTIQAQSQKPTEPKGPSLKRLFSQRFTLMLIPHTENRVINLQVNVLALITFVAVVLGFGIVSFITLTQQVVESEDSLTLEEEKQVLAANIDTLRQEIGNFLNVYEILPDILSNTLGEYDEIRGSIPGSGDIASIFELSEVNQGELAEVQSLRNLQDDLGRQLAALEELVASVDTQRGLLSDIPTLWPVYGTRKNVTMDFGPNRHPIHNNWYIHKGIDMYAALGTPILAAANGKVIVAKMDEVSGYGNTVVIEHKYGFKTRYSHMLAISVTPGQEVSQGDQVGLLGNTGLSTGAHLDFQIILGSDVIDPTAFLNIQNSFTRWVGGTRPLD